MKNSSNHWYFSKCIIIPLSSHQSCLTGSPSQSQKKFSQDNQIENKSLLYFRRGPRCRQHAFLAKSSKEKKNKSRKIFNCSWLWNSLFIYYIMQIAMLGSHKDNQLCLIYTNFRVFVSRTNIRAYVSRFSIT